VAAVQAAHEDLKANHGCVLVTGGGLALENDAMAAAAANWGIASLGIAKAAQRKLVHVMHAALAKDGIYVAEVTVLGGVRCPSVGWCVRAPHVRRPA
jgi:2-keto-3-deoxy-galactonokinase